MCSGQERSYPYTRSEDKDTRQGSQIRKDILLTAHYSLDYTDFYWGQKLPNFRFFEVSTRPSTR